MINLNSKIDEVSNLLFRLTASLQVDYIYKRQSQAEYNTETGVVDDSSVGEYPIKVIEDSFDPTRNYSPVISKKGVDTAEKIVSFLTSNLPVNPDLDDVLVDTKGITWKIIGISNGVNGTITSLFLRR